MVPVWLILAAMLSAAPASPARLCPLPVPLAARGGALELPRGGRPASLAPLVEAVRPTVVGVTTREYPGRVRRMLNRVFGDGPWGLFSDVETGLGSGVIIDPSGLVLTNNHVVEGADLVLVKTESGREYEAEVVGTDEETDVALLRLQGVEAPLPSAELGDSRRLEVGDFVVAIGNPFGLDFTVTSGIISAKSRELGESAFDSYLQTDAAINPGNSGGPLFDLRGRVVGINTAIVDQADGIGFAVPSELIRTLLPQLERNGRVVRGFLGVSLRDLSYEDIVALDSGIEQGAYVESVKRHGPAAQAGLRAGDVVVGLHGEPVADAAELTREIASLEPGQRVTMLLVREGAMLELDVTLGERPSR